MIRSLVYLLWRRVLGLLRSGERALDEAELEIAAKVLSKVVDRVLERVGFDG